MILTDLKSRLAELYPGTDPLTAEQIDGAYTTLAAETVAATREYRVTCITLAAEPPVGIGPDATRRVITAIRTAATGDVLVDEVLQLMRSGVGPDAGDAALGAQLAALVTAGLLEQTDVDAITGLATVAVPAWPGLTVDLINLARAL